MRLRLTERAERDVAGILRETRRLFGTQQLARYATLLDQAIARVADQPATLGSRERPELGRGIRSFSIALAGKRLSAGSHVLYYLADTAQDDEHLVILRILHESMEPKRRVLAAIPRETS